MAVRAQAVAALVALLAAGATPAAERVAVWGVQAANGVDAGATEVLGDVLATELAKIGRWQVIGRSDLVAVLGYERQRQVLGCAESGCLAEIGGAIGADLVLSGQAGRIGSQFRLSLLLVDAHKAVAVARAARFCEPTEDALARAVPDVLAELVAAMPSAGTRDAPATAAALLEKAGKLAAGGSHAESAQTYDLYPARFPDGTERCLATFKAGAEWEAAGKKQLAADRFLAVGSDDACGKSGPNAAASALARAGGLYEALGRAGEAREAFRRLVELPGVTDPSARAKVESARMRLQLDTATR